MGFRATLKFRKFKVAFGFKFTVNLRGKPLKIISVCILQLKTREILNLHLKKTAFG